MFYRGILSWIMAYFLFNCTVAQDLSHVNSTDSPDSSSSTMVSSLPTDWPDQSSTTLPPSSEVAYSCSLTGHCTCVDDDVSVRVTCTSLGDRLDEIAEDIPERTTHLILRNNGITKLSNIGILHLRSLQVLDLRDNNITTPGDSKLQSIIGGLLQVLLDNNPLECDCRITRSLLSANVSGTCAQPPALRGVEISSVLPEDFNCARSCAELFVYGRRSDGPYMISPPPLPGSVTLKPFTVWCDMSGLHGGWLVLQQRINGTINFFKGWNAYVKGFGKIGFEFWFGNNRIHALTLTGRHVLRLEMLHGNGRVKFAEYDRFRVDRAIKNNVLQVGQYRGNLGNLLSAANNSAFSTRDRDNDRVKGACAVLKKGAWWYKGTCDVEDFNSGLLNFTARGLVRVTMKTKPAKFTEGSCYSNAAIGRVECGWAGITEEQCLTRDCCYDNSTIVQSVICFIKPHLVFFERTGCFAVNREQIRSLEKQDPLLRKPYQDRIHPTQVCGTVARSRGFKGFAVRDGGECLADVNFPAIFQNLKASRGCAGGRGGKSVADVYHFTVFVAKLSKLRTSHVTSTSVRVEWDQVPQPFILGYRVTVLDSLIDKLIDWRSDHADIDGLNSNTTYVIRVSPVHGLTDKRASEAKSPDVVVTTQPLQGPGEQGPTYRPPQTNVPTHIPTKPDGPTGTHVPTMPDEPTHVPTKPDGPTGTHVPTGPDEPTMPDEPTHVPTKPDGPTGTHVPTGPDEPTMPDEPTHVPTRPDGPTGTHVPTGPDEPTHVPTKPDAPTGTHVPTGPDEPTRPDEPTHVPTKPDGPTHVPTGPDGPTKPDGPTGTHVPTGPDEPTHVPTKPDEPTGPDGPTKPAGQKRTHVPTGTHAPTGTQKPMGPEVTTGPQGPQEPQGPQGPQTSGKVPTRAPPSVSVRNHSARSLVVSWTPVPEQFLLGPLIGYQFYYGPANQQNSTASFMVPNVTTYVLPHLSVFTLYVIQVSAVTRNGAGPKSEPAMARTGESEPSAPPSEFRLDYVSSSSIIVGWDPVPKGSANGLLQGYKVMYQKRNVHRRSAVSVSYQRVDPDIFRATLEGLRQDTAYRIQVAAYTQVGDGPFTEPIIVRTKSYNPCLDKPCLNGGTCVIDQKENRILFRCYCSRKFTGALCESFMGERPCLSPNVSLPNLSSAVSSAVRVLRSQQFLIRSEVLLDCKLSYKTLFEWKVYQLNSATGDNKLRLSRNGSSELQISRRSLPAGVYLVRLTVSMLGTQVFGVGQGYIRVTRSPLVALIAGGTKVERGFNTSFVLDASSSRDPDDKNGLASDLVFTWLCRNASEKYSSDLLDLSPVLPSLANSGLDRGGCYGTGPGKIGSNEPVLKINSGLMLENSSYYITVVVEKDRRRVRYTQEVVIVPGDPPEVQISCVDNCDLKMNPSRRIALRSTCSGLSCGGLLSYRWSLFKFTGKDPLNKTQWLKVPKLQGLLRTRVTSQRLVTNPGVLTPGTLYKFTLRGQRRGGHPGFSEYEVTTNSPPTGGTCNVSPQSGTTLETNFLITCSGWVDTEVPLRYEFIYFTTDEFPNMVYNGQRSRVVTNLPAGERTNNFTVDFRVRVNDVMGAFTEIKIPIQVFEPKKEASELVNFALNLTTGDDSELASLIQSGDLSRATQLASAAIVAVDEDTRTHPATQDQLKDKRTAIKSSIVKQLSAVRVETVERIQQTSGVIAQATTVIDEVSEEAQKAATDALETMATALKVESEAGENYEALLDGAGSLVSGLGNMLRVTSYRAKVYDSDFLEESQNQDNATVNTQASRKDEWTRTIGDWMPLFPGLPGKRQKKSLVNSSSAKNSDTDVQLKSKKDALKVLHSLDEVGSTILSRTLIGEAPRKLSARSVYLQVSREEPGLLAAAVFSQNRSSFTLPSAPDVFGNDTVFVDSQMMTTDFTPFTWDQSGGRLTSGVASLEMKNSTGYLLNITKLDIPISVTLPQSHNTVDKPNNSSSYFVGPNRTAFHKVHVTRPDMALILKVRPVNNATKLVVSLRYKERPLPGNNDFSATIPDYSTCARVSNVYVNCSRDPYMVLFSNAYVKQTGFYFIGITIKSTNTSPGSPRVKRCAGRGRAKRSCVDYKESPPTTASTAGPGYHVPQYSKEDENYTMQVLPAACLYWSAGESVWTTKGCRVDEKTSADTIHCLCDHLTAFGGQLFVEPNPIDFDKVFTEFTNLPETGNVAVIVAVGCAFGFYLLLLVWARKKDKQDAMKTSNKPFLGVLSALSHRYEVQVSTGIWFNAGTSANVYVVLYGERGVSPPFHLRDDSCILFARGSVITFSLSLPRNIGAVQSVRVWHDNSGPSPSWFLNQITVADMSTQQRWIFTCHAWLAAKQGDGSAFCTAKLSPNNNGTDVRIFVQEKIAEEFTDSHLWFSVVTRPPCKSFTRVQRLSCCLLLLLTTMLASAMFYQFGPETGKQQGFLRLGRLVLNVRQLVIALESLLVVLPVNVLTVKLFSLAKPASNTKVSRLRYSVGRLQGLPVSKESSKKGCRLALPFWFTYVAWVLCFLSSTASGTFVIFYSLQWGKEISEEWLISIFMSMFVDIFVSQPVKIIVVALLLSYVCTAGSNGDDAQQSSYAGSIHSLRDVQMNEYNNNEKLSEERSPLLSNVHQEARHAPLGKDPRASLFQGHDPRASRFPGKHPQPSCSAGSIHDLSDIEINEPNENEKAEESSTLLSKQARHVTAGKGARASSYSGSIHDLGDIEITESDIVVPSTPGSEKRKRAESEFMKELLMYKVLRKILVYLVYLWILMTICYGGRSRDSYLMTSSVRNTFGDLTKISSQRNFLDWAREVLVPGLYEDSKAVRDTSSSPYTGDGDAVLVGMPRLRQFRVKKDSCEVLDEVRRLFNSCVASYTPLNEDHTLFYLPKWLPAPSSENKSLGDLYNTCPRPWRYSSLEQAQSLPFWGRLQFSSIYSQGGYLADLGYDANTALKVISELSLFNWTDKFTSAVLVEFTVFNSQVNLFSSVVIPVEFSPSGHVVSDHVIRTMHVYNLGGGYSTLLLICQVLLPLFVLYFAVRETKRMIINGRKYFAQFLNWVELLQILTAVGFIVTHVVKETQLFANTAKLHENIFQFISFDKEVLLDDTETALLALLMFFNTLKMLHLVKFNSHVQRLFNVMKLSALDLVNCSLVFFVFIFAFSHYGYLQFGGELLDYSTPLTSFQSLILQGVINDRVEHLQACHEILGPLFFVVFNMGLHVLWINIFTAILIYSYHTTERVSTLGSFMVKRMKDMLGCLGSKTKMQKKESRIGSRKEYQEPGTKPEPQDQTDKMAQITNKLNECYVDEFSSDLDLVFLLLTARAREKDTAEQWAAACSKEDPPIEKHKSVTSLPTWYKMSPEIFETCDQQNELFLMSLRKDRHA